jgi:L-ribulose-5-phosphate 4-epimerase
MGFEILKERVCAANKEIGRTELAILTWGNASEVDRVAGVFAIKPSGVDYGALTPDDIVIVSLETGEKVEGELNPSSDTPSHWHLYRVFPDIGGIVHTHSAKATAWAQAKRNIPAFGTTHADYFYGPVPCTRELTREEVEAEYELNTGKVIEEHFVQNGIEPLQMPAVLVACHGPFVWGADAAKAVECGITLEEVAGMALNSLALNPALAAMEPYLLDKHFLRKHGATAYYGQKKRGKTK